MPRPRFDKLPAARQVRLIEAAAIEFGAHGYEDASINRILERAGVSKGAAYYYFDDKEDLFLTVIRYYLAELGLDAALGQLPATVNAETFWPALTELYRQPLVHSLEHPWAFGLLRAAGELRSKGRYEGEGALAVFIREQFAVLAALLKRGQELGVIRTDIPDDLLMAWVEAVDDAHDRWLLKHWRELDQDALGASAERVVDGLRRLVGSHAT